MTKLFLIILKIILVNQINQVRSLKDRQELKNSLIVAQDTAVIQVLLDLYLLIKKVFFLFTIGINKFYQEIKLK